MVLHHFFYVVNRYFGVTDLTPMGLFSYRLKMKELDYNIFVFFSLQNCLLISASV